MTGPEPSGLLGGQVVIVAGVGPGLGVALGRSLLGHGASVVLAARTPHAMSGLVGALDEGMAERTLEVPADLSDPAQRIELVHVAQERFGKVDALVHNAFGRGERGPLLERGADAWTDALQRNVVAATAMAATVVPAMPASGGSILFVGSISARRPHPGSGLYAAMKSAMVGVARALAIELGSAGVSVNTIVPGYIEGPTLEAFFEAEAAASGGDALARRRMAEASTALGRFARPDEIAEVAAMMVAPSVRALTGQCVDVNAGQQFA